MVRVQWGALALAACVAAGPAMAAGVDGQTLNRIADEGFNHGEVASTLEYLSDQIGGRMTNSPAMRKAEQWTQGQFKAWGLSNVRLQPFEFGRGWWIEASSVRMTAPRPVMLRAIPVAWTPPTSGPVSAPIVVAPLRTPRDFAAWRGKLKGKIVLTSQPTAMSRDENKAAFERLNDSDLSKMNVYREPDFDPTAQARNAERRQFRDQVDKFLAEEGAVAWASMSRSDGGTVHGEGSAYKVGQTPKLPGVEIAAEDYRRLARLAKVGEVTLEIDSKVHFDDSDTKANNVLADIPGSDPKAGYVMAGAHLDSWVAGDGATDNGAGSAVVMEAARILASMHVKPKRGIRFALWAGEEEGLLGSYAYVDQYLAHRPVDPKYADLGPYYTSDSFPITTLPGYGDLQGYFNIDNGSGKVRGIYAEGNFAAAPILKDWLSPFASLGATTVVAEPTGSTDHVFMVKLGLPAFQFIQDPLDYETTTHHTNLDTYDHVRPDDLRQAAVILAAMLLDAAESEKPLPRNVLPTQPKPTQPFKYPEPTNP